MAQQITHSGLDEAVKQSPKKWVYLFSEGNAKMRELLALSCPRCSLGSGTGCVEQHRDP